MTDTEKRIKDIEDNLDKVMVESYQNSKKIKAVEKKVEDHIGKEK